MCDYPAQFQWPLSQLRVLPPHKPLPKSLNISYHFTFFKICVQPKNWIWLNRIHHQNSKLEYSTWSYLWWPRLCPPGEDIKTKRHSWATQVLGVNGLRDFVIVCVGSFGYFFIHIYIFFLYINILMYFLRYVSMGGGFKSEHVQPIELICWFNIGWRSPRSLISNHHRPHNKKICENVCKNLANCHRRAFNSLQHCDLVPMTYHKTYMFHVFI